MQAGTETCARDEHGTTAVVKAERKPSPLVEKVKLEKWLCVHRDLNLGSFKNEIDLVF